MWQLHNCFKGDLLIVQQAAEQSILLFGLQELVGEGGEGRF